MYVCTLVLLCNFDAVAIFDFFLSVLKLILSYSVLLERKERALDIQANF